LLTRRDRQPLHAAALVQDGAGVLLYGPSGSGKSTLAYAAARSGMHVVSEDIVFVQRQPHLHVWGSPGPFRLLPSAAAGFAELAAVAPTRLHNGKEKVIVAAHASAAAGRARVVRDCGVCVLGERRAEAQVRPLSGIEVMSLIDLTGDPGFDAFADAIAPAVARLARNGAWLLHPSRSPGDSIPLLAYMLAAVGARRENAVAGA
jgi:serine kinase of HPr protein (carbohydrate metabolism regulator)